MLKSILVAITLLMSTTAYAGEESRGEGRALQSALDWLNLIDSGQYKESWNAAAPYFQSRVSSSQWLESLKPAREPLGKLLSRDVVKSSTHESLPGLPDGEYIVLSLDSSFAYKKSATETLTLVKEGEFWRAVGYFIK